MFIFTMLKINTVTMREKIIEILESYEVSSLDISDLTNELLDLFDVSYCECSDNFSTPEVELNKCFSCGKKLHCN